MRFQPFRYISCGKKVLGPWRARPSMRKITQQQSVLKKNLRIIDARQNTHREREREREAQKNISIKNATITMTTNQPLQKVTNSLYIVTNLGKLPFMLITEMVRTWAIKEDSVNTSIIQLYSTLPRNGRIHRLSKKYRYRHRFSDRSVLLESAGSESKRPNWSGRKS